VVGYGQLGILRRFYFVPLLSHSFISVKALTVGFSKDPTILHKESSSFNFDAMRAFKSNGLYKIGLH